MRRREVPVACDVLIVGGGIVGLASARELLRRRPGLSLCLLEREATIASHQTTRSSGVIHAGIYYEPGSLKARLCVEGARELYEYCEERGIPARRTGKLILATAPEEIPRLDELERRGRANGVPGLARIGAGAIHAIEPHAAGIDALHSPATGVVDFGAVAAAIRDDIAAAGGALVTSCEVWSLRPAPAAIRVTHARGMTSAAFVLTCAGAWSDRLAVEAGADPEPRIVPFRGGYLRLRPDRDHLVRASIYPVPDPALPFLGAHLTRGHDGAVTLGPSALLVGARDGYSLHDLRLRDLGETLTWPGTRRLMRRHWRAGLREIAHAASRRTFAREARRLVPALRPADFTHGPAGIRAQAVARDGSLVDDFVVSETDRALHVRNAPSPAATSALALARLIACRQRWSRSGQFLRPGPASTRPCTNGGRFRPPLGQNRPRFGKGDRANAPRPAGVDARPTTLRTTAPHQGEELNRSRGRRSSRSAPPRPPRASPSGPLRSRA